MPRKKIGLLTGGSDCPGLNAAVRAATKAALRRGWEVTGFIDGYSGLVEDNSVTLTDAAVSGIACRGGTILGTTNEANPFSYSVPPFGTADTPQDVSDKVVATYKKHNLDALVVIGGNGTLSIADRLAEKGLFITAAPKTIDNDLTGTDVTVGFDSALSLATDAVDRLHSTAEAHHRVMIVETMGRYAGWIALRAGVAGGGDIILIPEIPYNADEISAAIAARMQCGKHFSIVVVAEGAAPEGAEGTAARKVKSYYDSIKFGGAGYRIGKIIEDRCGMRTRVVVLGHLQRGGTPTAFDRWLATRFGEQAVELIEQGKRGHMACLVGMSISSAPLADAVKHLRLVDPQGPEVRSALRLGTSFASRTIK